MSLNAVQSNTAAEYNAVKKGGWDTYGGVWGIHYMEW